MEQFHLTDDLKTFYVKAASFRHGVKAAFDKLQNMLPTITGRTFFGISYMEEGTNNIIYKAAVLESFDGEAEKYGCETFIIKKGEYLTETIKDWMKKMGSIGPTFNILLEDPRMDRTFPCVEWYKGDDVMCMVKINE
ncbi:MAG TPA: hypothetical protein VN721_06340 [Flavipsychrobacter sp.]|nr:hypothetical protein [Flavipsychrobacter sp.]